ncbi:MAG: imidazole glycerol phosphate synthase subunit HisH [Lachnospiraceae bacterium]|nr:imidazole glycerol phosphate synthase subunit HisH [Lachnospiraceae bacterium]
MIAIVDYDAGNLKSVEKALRFLGAETCVTRDFGEIRSADALILPGVGAFGVAMDRLKALELDKAIREFVQEQSKPFLGICLGLQLLFFGSEESEGVEGLSLLPGEIVRIPEGEGRKVPHIGWNSLHFPKQGQLFAGLPAEPYVYFVHSYYLKAQDPAIVTAQTTYGPALDVSVEKGKLFACQFHPEKSGRVGLAILKNFLAMTGGNH